MKKLLFIAGCLAFSSLAFAQSPTVTPSPTASPVSTSSPCLVDATKTAIVADSVDSTTISVTDVTGVNLSPVSVSVNGVTLTNVSFPQAFTASSEGQWTFYFERPGFDCPPVTITAIPPN